MNNRAVPALLEHNSAVHLVTRVSKTQFATTPIPWSAVVATILADAQIQIFQSRVRNRVVSSTLY